MGRGNDWPVRCVVRSSRGPLCPVTHPPPSLADWTRYSSRRYGELPESLCALRQVADALELFSSAPTLSQLVAAPLTITLTALLGIVITSASSNILGAIYWSPITLLVAIQDHYGSSSGGTFPCLVTIRTLLPLILLSSVRAAVFFGGLGCAFSQLAVNVVLNAVSHGMDMAGLAPRYINIRRGAYIIGAVGGSHPGVDIHLPSPAGTDPDPQLFLLPRRSHSLLIRGKS